MTESKFNLIVYFEGAVRFDRDKIQEQIEEASTNPDGPADDPMFADNMNHRLDGVYMERNNTYPHVRVALDGVGLVGPEASIVSKETVDRMEQIILENTEGEHYTTVYSADAL